MTKGSPWKLITQFAVPVFLSQVFQQLYNTADALIVGRFLGDEALAAVSASGPLIFLLISFFTGLSMGAGVTISRYFGAGDYGRVSKAIHTDVMLGLLSGTVLTVVGVLLTPTFLRWMGTAPEVLPDAIAYFQYYFFGVLAVVMYNMCKSIMNALGDSKRPLYYLIISSLTNIVLDLLFIGGFGWGVWAAAVATTISQAVSMVLCLIHLMKKGTIYQLKPKELRIDRRSLRRILQIGLPAGIQSAVFSVANIVIQSAINSLGTVVMAASSAAYNIEIITYDILNAFSQACTTFVGQNFGAGELQRCKRTMLLCLAEGVTVLAVAIGVVLFFGKSLLAVFNNDPQVVEVGYIRLMTVMLAHFASLFYEVLSGYLRGFSISLPPALLTMLGVCGIRFSWIYWVFPKNPTFQTIMLVFPISLTATALLMLIAVLYYRPTRRFAALQKREQAAQ